ncbi:MAG: DUF2079 domain-containing protein [Candidatus Moranbacteria bacterium]|nr:DUF2079 domain-containing protein [Candidatus Moranbacteria bacterium]
MMRIKNKGLWLIVLFFLIIYSAFSLVNHYNFRTNAYDLGIFNQALYQYSHFESGPNTVRGVSNLLGDHFEPILILFSPFYYFFGSYTLLIVQVFLIILGGIGVFYLLELKDCGKFLAYGGVLIFFLFFGIYDALSFDYHNNVSGIMLLPWLLYFFYKRQFKLYFGLLFLFLLFKENLSLIAFFLGLMIIFFEDKKYKKIGFATVLISVIYFILIIFLVIPFFNSDHEYYYFSSYLDAAENFSIFDLLILPLKVTASFFDDELKIRMWVLLMLSGGFLAVLNPRFLVLIFPVIVMKFYSKNHLYWGHIFHYSVEFAPLVSIYAILAIKKFFRLKHRKFLVILLICSNIVILARIRFFDSTKVVKIFSKSHYVLSYDRDVLIEAFQKIPKNASVSAQNSIVPHLEDRREVFLFPHNKEADYFIFNLGDNNIWPVVNPQEIEKFIELKVRSGEYKIIFEENSVFVLKKSE